MSGKYKKSGDEIDRDDYITEFDKYRMFPGQVLDDHRKKKILEGEQ